MKLYLGLLILITAYSAPSAAQELLHKEDPLFVGKTSRDFIIRWLFQHHCDFVFDMRTDKWRWPTSLKGVTFDPSKVKPGDVIFVREIDKFFSTMHPQIAHPYIIVTHGESLDAMQKSYMPYLDEEKVIAWFGIHACKIEHPKFIPIPLGVAQDPVHYKKRNQLDTIFEKLRLESEKKYLVYLNFADAEKPERKKVRAYFSTKPYCKHGPRQEFMSYLKEMAQCKFTLSPKGREIDSYRTWEALLVGSIPIVRKSQLDPLYKGLPVLIIDDWEKVNEEFLNQKYEEIMSKKYDISKLYMEYWINKIEAVRQQFLEHGAAMIPPARSPVPSIEGKR